MRLYLSVIICTYNREIYLHDALKNIAFQDIDKNIYEVIIINNNSTDNTDSICKEFMSTHQVFNFYYFIEKNTGLSFARNRGIKESRGEILIFIDDDAMASPSYLSEIHTFFSNVKNKEFVAGGGKIIPEYEKEAPSWMSHYLLPVVSALDLGEEKKPFPKNKYPIGANMFFRANVFERHGYFNTNLGRKGKILLGSEEKDIFHRIGSKRNIIYLPKAVVRHIVPEERLKMDYIENMAIGVGMSLSIRADGNIGAYLRIIFYELYKWAGSLILFILFILKFQYSKAKMLLKFRYFVNKGILKKINNDHYTENI